MDSYQPNSSITHINEIWQSNCLTAVLSCKLNPGIFILFALMLKRFVWEGEKSSCDICQGDIVCKTANIFISLPFYCRNCNVYFLVVGGP